MEERIAREKKFHENRFKDGGDTRSSLDHWYEINLPAEKIYIERAAALSRRLRALEYGCGQCVHTRLIAPGCSSLVGIDISEEAVCLSRNKMAHHENCEFHVMNAENLTFPMGEFDVVYGTGILHHLDLDRSLSEIKRVLSRRGKMLFIEPMGHNPIINVFRALTPSMRSDDEHPLTAADLTLIRKYFPCSKFRFYSLFSLVAGLLPKSSLRNGLVKLLQAVDSMVLAIPGIKYLSWVVVIEAGSSSAESVGRANVR